MEEPVSKCAFVIFKGLETKTKQPNRICRRELCGTQSLKYSPNGPTHDIGDWRIYFEVALANVKFLKS